MEVLYAFERTTDDLADGIASNSDRTFRQHVLMDWRNTLEAAFDSDSFRAELPCDEILPALVDMARRFEIDPNDLLATVDGCLLDCNDVLRFETEADAYHYADLVATSVGRATLAILGGTQPRNDSLEQAIFSCGRAFQWTNFLRDILEDYRRERIYFPMSDFSCAGLAPNDWLALLAAGKKGRAVRRFRLHDPHDPLVKFFTIEFARTEKLYAEADRLDQAIAEDARRMFLLMKNVYRTIFQKIRENPGAVFERRVRLTLWEKFRFCRCRSKFSELRPKTPPFSE